MNQIGSHKQVRKEPHGSESGSATLEFSLVYGLMLGLILAVIHIGLLYHARLTLDDAADIALEILQTEGLGSASETAESAVMDVVGDSALVQNLQVSIEVNENVGTVTLSAESPRLLPSLPTQIQRRVSGPLEVFLNEESR